MLRVENVHVVGWEAAIRGMRNPMNSWDKSDSLFLDAGGDAYGINGCSEIPEELEDFSTDGEQAWIGPNDMDLMNRLRNAGTDHRKYLRMIVLYVDIIAPLYWWKEFDTYKVGTVVNSCSTMHKITEKEFTLEDFSKEHLMPRSRECLENTIKELNIWRRVYLNGCPEEMDRPEILPRSKEAWWQLIQLLPSSYNQKRTVMLSYEVLANIYRSRKNHKLDEWSRNFMGLIDSLPYSCLITGED